MNVFLPVFAALSTICCATAQAQMTETAQGYSAEQIRLFKARCAEIPQMQRQLAALKAVKGGRATAIDYGLADQIVANAIDHCNAIGATSAT